ncbi:MAG: efflux RND transporter periplasmic adaptor subunit [Methylococcaceae bacterium]|nr:efflux RND transporter periplasmic adaptor subunit [Methylococcaceae bacterium]
MFVNYRVIILLLCISLLSGCSEEKLKVEQRLRSVKYQEITTLSTGSSRTFSGVAKGSQEANLSFKIAGTIKNLPVKVGDQLKAGQLIAQLDASQYELQSQQAQATLAQSTAALRNTRAVLERLKGLYENNNASRQELDAARASADSTQAQVRVARKSLELAKLNLSYTQLKSVKACVVAEVNIENNENISSGQSIVKVSCGQQMNVEIAVPDSYVTLIKQQMSAQVSFSAHPDKSYSATVSEVSVTANGGATFPVTLALNDNPENIRSGMVVEVKFLFTQQANSKAIVIPAIAVAEDMQGRYVYVVESSEDENIGIIKRRQVIIGELTVNGLEIIEGLDLADKVVTAGVTVIRDGLKVRID